MAGPARKQRIGIITACAMLALAVVFDGLQDVFLFFNVLPGIGTAVDVVMSWFISALSTVVFGLWFLLCGVNYSGRNAAMKMAIIISSVVVELIPIIDALPAITFGVVALIVQTRIEDQGMSGLGISQVLGGAGQVAGAVGLKGAGSATKAILAGKFSDGTPFTPREHFLNLRMNKDAPKAPPPAQQNHPAQNDPSRSALSGSRPPRPPATINPVTGKPDWMHDQQAQKSVDLRNDRIAAAKRMGKSDEEARRAVDQIEARSKELGRV